MKKRLLSWLMVLTLCLTLLPTAALADTSESSGSSSETHAHYLCAGKDETGKDKCTEVGHSETDTTTFTAWTDAEAESQWEDSKKTAANSLPRRSSSGMSDYYYLTKDVELDDTWNPMSGMRLCLNGHSIRMKGNKSVISVDSAYYTFTLVDCKGGKTEYGQITHASGSGHGVELTGGTFYMYGGNITKNAAAHTGGSGVYMTGKSTFNMYDGQITDNSTTYYGGGVYSDSNSNSKCTFNMYDGEISRNTAGFGGGGVFNGNSSTFTMCGGEIIDNSCDSGKTNNGGGVRVSGTMTVSGDVKITGNTKGTGSDSTKNNVHLVGSDAVITIDEGGLGNKAEIGVTASTPSVGLAIATGTGLTETIAAKFKSDNDQYKVEPSTDGTQLVLVKNIHQHYLCGSNKCTGLGGHTEENGETTFETKLWMDGDTLKMGADKWELTPTTLNGSETALYVLPKGSYYLDSDIKLTASICIREDVQLCLNGWSIISDDYNLGSVIVETNSSDAFTLTDCQNSGSITHAVGQGGGGVYMNGNSTKFNMYGGSICGNQTVGERGGGVHACGTFNMYGGEISGNRTDNGGGVSVEPAGQFSMYGGTITGNSCYKGGYYGGGVHVYNGGNFNVSGAATITGNVEGGTFDPDTGKYTNDGSADNVYLYTTAKLTIKDKLTGEIGVTTRQTPGETPVEIATGATESDQNYVKSDKDAYEVKYDDGKLVLVTKTTPAQEHKHFLCGGSTCTGIGHNCGSDETDFATPLWMDGDTLKKGNDPWTKSTVKRADGGADSSEGYALTAGTYYLGSDLELSDAAILINEDVKLCLNGNTINRMGKSDYVIWILGRDKAHLTLTDCVGGGKLTGGYIGGVDIFNSCTLDMYGGAITGNENTGVSIGQFGTFNMYGGSITNNSASFGGGVYNGGIFNIYGGEIRGNTASSKGGGVYVTEYSTGFKVSGAAKITGNTVDEKANNVYLPKGKTITIGGTLTGDLNSIGVTTEQKPDADNNTVPVATGVGESQLDYSNVITPDDNNYKTQQIGDNIVLALKDGGTHEHVWNKYVKNENEVGRIDLFCSVSGCNESGGWIKITAPTNCTYTGDPIPAELEISAVWNGGRDFTDAVGYSAISEFSPRYQNAPKDIGRYRAYLTLGEDNNFARVYIEYEITEDGSTNKTNVSDKITFNDGELTYTGSGLKYEKATIADGYTGSFSYTYEVKNGGSLDENGLPVGIGTYTVTATYTDESNTGTKTATLTVKAASTPSTPSTPSSGSSSGSSTIKTETTTNPDGSVTKTETKSDGTVIETTTNPDGSVSKTESKTTTKSDGSTVETVTEANTNADGSKSTSKTETTTAKDGSKTETKSETKTEADGTKSETKSETKTDANGVKSGTETTKTTAPNGSTGTTTTTTENGNTKTEAEAKVSEKAVEDAKKSGEAVKVPTEVKAGEDSNSAPTVKVELPKNAGETKIEIPVSDVNSGTVAVIVHPDGTEEIVKDSKPTEDGVQLTVDGSATIKIIDNSKDFIDTRDHWSRDEVNFVASREIFNGVGNNLFGVGQPMTRGMVNTVLARLAGIDTTPKNGQKWYEVGTEWAKQNGITDGTNPEASVTREQLATLIYRFCGCPAVSGTLSFADAGSVSDYAQSALLWATQNGILNGVGNNRVAPGADAQRAQVAAMMARYLKNVG